MAVGSWVGTEVLLAELFGPEKWGEVWEEFEEWRQRQ